jgi:gamma-glutamyltranspeptidase/glutathione hydrolase
VLLGSLSLMSCSGKPLGVVGHVEGFAGMVVADEPRAAMIGRDVLSAGGSPADAAVAAALALTVTLPSQTGLGAGGVCLVFDHQQKSVEVLDFQTAASGDATPVPALTRGLYALFAKYGGGLRWEQLVTPAERMARLGQPVSRALAAHLALLPSLSLSPAAKALLSRPDGQPLHEGDDLLQPALGATLARIRAKGAAALYGGGDAAAMAASLAAAGPGAPDRTAIVGFTPAWRPSNKIAWHDDVVNFVTATPAPVGEGQLWADLLAGAGSDGDLDAERRLAPVLAFYDQRTPPARAGSTGLTVLGRDGTAVVCDFTLGRMFGSGRLAADLGFLTATAAHPLLQPLLVINPYPNEFRLALAAPPSAPDNGQPQGLAVIACASGSPHPASCRFSSDPKGAGLATLVGGE